MLRYNNLIAGLKEKPENIYDAFKGYITSEHVNSRQTVDTMIESGTYVEKLDMFLNNYGSKWGFSTPMSKELIRKFVLTKLQLRDKLVREKELGQFFNQTGVEPSKNKLIFDLIEQNMTPEEISAETGIDIKSVKHFVELYKTKQAPTYNSSTPNNFTVDREDYNEAKNKRNHKIAKKDKLHGGRADNKKPSDFNKKDLEDGSKIEYEHTNNPDITKEIAMDHLEEFPEYYSKDIGLPAMERRLKKKEKSKE
jgi:hypothetical protein